MVKDQNGQPLKTAQQALQNKAVQLVFMDGTVNAHIAPQAHIKPTHDASSE
jgi:exonuclease VII large subunit